MTDPGDERTAGAGGRGRLRASREDRARVIELLKDAFVQDRLTQDELDTRVGQALASRTHADLADLTADIPAGSATAEPAAAPARASARTLATAARRSGICMLVAFALVGVLVLTHSENLAAVAFFSGIAAVITAGTGAPGDRSPLCRHHYSCKQAGGWRLEQPEPGVLVWRGPSGRTYTVSLAAYLV